MLVPVILSGGSGTRLWPLSRRLHPKQLLPLCGAATMLQQTARRVEGLLGLAAPIVVCNEAHAPQVESQLHAIGHDPQAIVLEPVGRNTAPAVALAALVAVGRTDGGDPLLLCLPADHVVGDEAAFRAAVDTGRPLADAGRLVTFGVVPDHPHTGYGYIQADAAKGPAPVRAFVEKPDRETAEGYLAQGGYYWNSGMFLLRARAYLAELRQHAPAIVEACERALVAARIDGPRVVVDPEAFAACPSSSIDYAVMEKTGRASVVPLHAGWSDVGSWSALLDAGDRDAAGNAVTGDVLALDCEGSLLRSSSRLVAAIGLRDAVVVETADAVLVAPRSRSEDVKRVVDWLDRRGRPEAHEHRERREAFGVVRRLDDASWWLRIVAGARAPLPAAIECPRLLVASAGAGTLTTPEGERAIAAGDTVVVPAGQEASAHAHEAGLTLLLVERPADAATRTDS